MEGFIIIALIVYIVIAHFTGKIAEQRGYTYVGFFIFSLFAPLIALLIASFLSINTKAVEAYSTSPSGNNKKCPYCAELIKFEAKVCRYCGKELTALKQFNNKNSNSHPYSFVHGNTTIHHNNKTFIVNGKEFSSSEDAKAYAETV